MVDDHTDQIQESMASDPKLPILRLRLNRRIGQALRPLETDLTLLPGENIPLPADPGAVRTIRTDLILQSLDLRLRIVALPGQAPKILPTEELRTQLAQILLEFPETAAVVAVADDEALSAQLFEPLDLFSPLGIAEQAAANPEAMPLPELVRAYLRRLSPGWREPTFVGSSVDDIAETSIAAASEAAALLLSRKKITEEARLARQSISRKDAIAISKVVLAALQGDQVDDALEAIIDSSGSSPS